MNARRKIEIGFLRIIPAARSFSDGDSVFATPLPSRRPGRLHTIAI